MNVDEILTSEERWLTSLVSIYGEQFVFEALSLLNINMVKRSKTEKKDFNFYSYSGCRSNCKNCLLECPWTIVIFTNFIKCIPHVYFCSCNEFKIEKFCVHLLAIKIAAHRIKENHNLILLDNFPSISSLLFN